MLDKKNKNFDCGMACVLVPAIGIVGFMLSFWPGRLVPAVAIMSFMISFLPGRDGARDSEYIVTDKGVGKIAYYSINNPADSHVMEFKDTVSFYPYVNVGDTITGVYRHIDRKVAPADYTTNRGTYQVISTVNGRSLPEVREIARRDSILREMKTKQR